MGCSPRASDRHRREVGKSVAQVVLRWMIRRNVVVIPKSVNPDRMAQNLDGSTSRSPTTT